MIELRDLTEDSGGSCDWGYCDEIAVAERRAPDHECGWLPVCERHTGRREARPSPGKAPCPECGKSYALTVDGRMRAHDNGFAIRCPGSRRAAPETADV